MKQIYSGFNKQFLGFVTIVMLVSVAACSPAIANPPAPTPTPATAPAPAPTPISYSIKTASRASIGDYLVDSKGMTLYYFTKDTITKSNATGAILQAWPIFNTDSFVVPSSLKADDFGTIARDDGLKQSTYKGWPLYYFAKDQVPGDTLGEAVNGIWFVMKIPFYTVMLQTKTGLGNYLVDAKGMTLYHFTKDTITKSNATGAVLQAWPIFNTDIFVIPSSLKATDFSTIIRDDGLKQATYKGWPLYYFAKDQVPGEGTGQGVNGVWFVVSPEGLSPVSAPTPPLTKSDDGSADTRYSSDFLRVLPYYVAHESEK